MTRKRWRTRTAALLPAAAALALGFTDGAAHGGQPTVPIGTSAATTNVCSAAVASSRPLSVRTALVPLGAPPFGVAITTDARWSFVDEMGGHVAVLSTGGFRPRVAHTIGVPLDALGSAMTGDGRYLLVADGRDGATVIGVRAAERGGRGAVLGTLSEPVDSGSGGAIEVTSSPDGRYAFVAVEYESRVAVYDLRAAIAGHFRRSTYIGSVPLGQLVDGLAVSPDGRWLYATSELAAGSGPLGTLSVVRLGTAERQPSRSVVASIPAGCAPVRVVVTSDGRTAWVAARGSNEVLAFSTAKLISDPAHSERTAVGVGAAPIGMALVNGGRELVVADSNRFNAPGASAGLTVVKTGAALAHRPALLGMVRTGTFPREMALEPGRPILLVGDFGSDQLQAVDLRRLQARSASGTTHAALQPQAQHGARPGVIAFQSNRTGQFEIFTTRPTGAGVRQLTQTASTVKNLIPAYSPDGRKMVFYGSASGHFEIYTVDPTGADLRQITRTAVAVTNADPAWQPLPELPRRRALARTSSR